MNASVRGRFEFNRAERFVDGMVHVLGIALGLAAAAALIAHVVASAPLADLFPVSISSLSLLTVLIISTV